MFRVSLQKCCSLSSAATSAVVPFLILASRQEQDLESPAVEVEVRQALLPSLLAQSSQKLPVTAAKAVRFVLIDGHKRARAPRRLDCDQDTIPVTVLQVDEVDALLFERALRRGCSDALDQARLLAAELQERFGCSLEQLAIGFAPPTGFHCATAPPQGRSDLTDIQRPLKARAPRT
jgi:hypothetical protein